ncbi:PREDICTED: uncharacterized protein LOC109342405 [Lupinus angustifolius]|uniref:uncharacterized protein LOC109342405 n=1 Tax=Lupinus angustifolius TaxID=3871 RepID=UPI00092FB864|nr:PREDICTED: uncharacterized protein LOC109342405 [Lupinus angustifolius]
MSSTIPLIPWSFLGDLDKDSQAEKVTRPVPPTTASKKSFAQALRSSCDIATSLLPQPCIKGDAIAIKIPEEDYLAGGIGTPISMDEATHTRSFDHFAKVMVELNLKVELPDQILVEREGFSFLISIEYENLPDFCQRCHVIGHAVHQCRKPSKKGEAEVIPKYVQKNPKLVEKPEEEDESSNENIIGQETADLNQVAASDIHIVGRLWADDEATEEAEEEFTTVLSKSQKRKLRKKEQSEKLKRLKKELKHWNYNVFGNIHQMVKMAKANMDTIQSSINEFGTDEALLDQEALAQNELLKTKNKESSKLQVGDSILSEQNDIADHVQQFYTNLFESPNLTSINALIQSVIPKLVSDVNNLFLTKLPSSEEIKQAVISMSGDSSPGPDGFEGCFYQQCWDIVHLDVCNSVKQFFSQGWLLSNINANYVVLIPKTKGADKIKDFRPIAMANFQFKIITKVLADRLASISPKIISTQQRGFMYDRKIQDCIWLASEAINLLDYKTFGGNIAIKLDIKKVFDTLYWNFLIDTLMAFGFNNQFCNWIKVIIRSVRLSINVNGSNVGFFKCSRCVRQGKPRRVHLQPIADINKLTIWKGVCLSIMGRVELVKSIIQSMLVYNFHIYKWPSQLLTLIDKVKLMNKASLTKLALDMRTTNHEWAEFYRNRFGCNSIPSSRNFKSSIWPGIRDNWELYNMKFIWVVGNGLSINFWKDNWLGQPIVDQLNIPQDLHKDLHATMTLNGLYLLSWLTSVQRSLIKLVELTEQALWID